MEGIGLPDGCLLGLKIKACSWLLGSRDPYGSIGKQVSLPLHHPERHWHHHIGLVSGLMMTTIFSKK